MKIKEMSDEIAKMQKEMEGEFVVTFLITEDTAALMKFERVVRQG